MSPAATHSENRKHAMAELIPQLLFLATGDILSPLSIAALITVLLTPHARLKGAIFTGASIIGVFAVTLFGALSGHSVHATGSTGSDVLLVVLGLVFGVGLLALAVMSWHRRPGPGQQAKEPGWLKAADKMTPIQVGGLGLTLAVANATGLPMSLKAGVHIGTTGWGLAPTLLLSLAFAVLGCIVLIALTGLAALNSSTINKALDRTKAELISKNSIIIAVVLVMLSFNQFSDALRILLR